ncbi:hypothetical protein H5410_004740 [Solanum commersonii]|uniref:Uncharacterized protein n=1 Tax=Solanum commersonii TaxID=4109 RepID=A0A9J6A576_SOLCO|nr:hypothetical protein H5410_004740 [Solanum commersonii]
MHVSWLFDHFGHLHNIRAFSDKYKKNHFRAVTTRSKVLFSYSSRYFKVIGASRNFLRCFCIVVTKRSKVCLVTHQDILWSLVQVKIFVRHFLYRLCVFLYFSAILGNLRNIRPFFSSYEKNNIRPFSGSNEKNHLGHLRNIHPFWIVTKRSKALFTHSSRYSKFFGAITKRSKVLFSYSSRYSKIIGASQKKFEAFFGIYIIFGNFWAGTKRSKVLFSYSLRYSKVIGASWNFFDAFF